MSTAVVLFTRDLRVVDQPALVAAAAESSHVQPLFVLDPAQLRASSPNRTAFLLEALADLDRSLSHLGAPLAVRFGDAVVETVCLARELRATSVHLSGDVSRLARRREERLQRDLSHERIGLHLHPGVTVVPPGDLAPAGGDHYRVFTAFWRRWSVQPLRARLAPPDVLTAPRAVRRGRLPGLGEIQPGLRSPSCPGGGETAGRRRLASWLASGADAYDAGRDDLAADVTSRLGAYLHFGCLSPLEIAERLVESGVAGEMRRQLCWRDFFHQLLAARPELDREDMHPGRREWSDRPDALAAWREGRTGYPLVDAGMRQLQEEGFMHNRARLVTASFLTRTLGVDWREGARQFAALLADADVASNAGNWQWVAGTGANPRPGRVLNPTRQARRFDPGGDYVRRFVPELAGVAGARVHEPWLLGRRRPRAYVQRIVIRDQELRVPPATRLTHSRGAR